MLHHVLREHLESFLEEGRFRGAREGLPAFVERELRKYLTCGILARGFARFRCDECKHEILVAFSCKGRGFCPSCCGRRMADLAAHLVDDVLGGFPVRQWVLTLPHRLRYALAWDHELCRTVLAVFIRALLTFERRRAERRGIRGGRGGAVTAIQRFGSALNLNVHFHTLAIQGVFIEAPSGSLRFVPNPAPTDLEVAKLLASIRRRIARLTKRHGIELDSPSEEVNHFDPLASESLRPPVAQDALELTPQGNVLLKIRRPWHDGTRAILFEPRELIARLCSIIPKPRINLLLYHGVLGPSARLRRAAVGAATMPAAPHADLVALDEATAELSEQAPDAATRTHGASVNPEALADSSQAVPHGGRVLDPEGGRSSPDDASLSPGRSRSTSRPHTPWAALMQRAFDLDVLACPGCGGRLRLLATIEDPDIVRRILSHLGLPTESPEALPARSPPWTEQDFSGVLPGSQVTPAD